MALGFSLTDYTKANQANRNILTASKFSLGVSENFDVLKFTKFSFWGFTGYQNKFT